MNPYAVLYVSIHVCTSMHVYCRSKLRRRRQNKAQTTFSQFKLFCYTKLFWTLRWKLFWNWIHFYSTKLRSWSWWMAAEAGSCTENVNNNKLPALCLTNWSCALFVSHSFCLSLSCRACVKLRHTISSSFSALLSFSRTSAGKQRLGLATLRPVPPLRFASLNFNVRVACKPVLTCSFCDAPPHSLSSCQALSLSSNWVTLRREKVLLVFFLRISDVIETGCSRGCLFCVFLQILLSFVRYCILHHLKVK